MRVTDALTGVTDYAFDARDDLTDVTDPRGLVTSFVHDGFGNAILRKPEIPDKS